MLSCQINTTRLKAALLWQLWIGFILDIEGPIQRVTHLWVGALGYVEGLIAVTHALLG